jgi:hypothetical protein
LMTDTEVMADDSYEIEEDEEEEQEDEIFYEIYTEVATNMLYEVQMFSDFVLVRPASPSLYTAIRKLSVIDFSKEFREYYGDAEAVRETLRSSRADLIVE